MGVRAAIMIDGASLMIGSRKKRRKKDHPNPHFSIRLSQPTATMSTTSETMVRHNTHDPISSIPIPCLCAYRSAFNAKIPAQDAFAARGTRCVLGCAASSLEANHRPCPLCAITKNARPLSCAASQTKLTSAWCVSRVFVLFFCLHPPTPLTTNNPNNPNVARYSTAKFA